MNSTRYVAIGREVWDAAWSSPREGTWTAGLKREAVVTLYPSEQAALEAAQSLNDNEPTTMAERAARFKAAAANALADKADSDAVRSTLLPAWVEDIEGLDSL